MNGFDKTQPENISPQKTPAAEHIPQKTPANDGGKLNAAAPVNKTAPAKKRTKPPKVKKAPNEHARLVAAKVCLTAAPILFFIIGQVIMWVVYAKTGYALLLSEIWNAIFKHGDLMAIIIYSPIWGGVATGLIAYVGYVLADEYEGWKAFWIVLVFCLLMAVAPGAMWPIAFIYAIVMKIIQHILW